MNAVPYLSYLPYVSIPERSSLRRNVRGDATVDQVNKNGSTEGESTGIAIDLQGSFSQGKETIIILDLCLSGKRLFKRYVEH